jgi:hypothetical protein
MAKTYKKTRSFPIPSFLLRKLDEETRHANEHFLKKHGHFHVDKQNIWKTLPQYGSGKEIVRANYLFKYNEDNDMIIALSKHKGLPCFRVTFESYTKSIEINISYYSDCAHNQELPSGKGTQIMLGVVFELIAKNPNFPKYRRISITDNSSIVQYTENKDEYYVKLADMYFICTGCTWYSSLAPMFLQNKKDERTFLEDRSHIIGPTALSWQDFLKKLPNNISTYLKKLIHIESQSALIPGSASVVLRRMKELKKYSIIFYKFHDEFLRAFNIGSLFEKEWSIALFRGKILVPMTGPTYECQNPKGWLIPESFLQTISNTDYQIIKDKLQTPMPAEIDINTIKLEKINIGQGQGL